MFVNSYILFRGSFVIHLDTSIMQNKAKTNCFKLTNFFVFSTNYNILQQDTNLREKYQKKEPIKVGNLYCKTPI